MPVGSTNPPPPPMPMPPTPTSPHPKAHPTMPAVVAAAKRKKTLPPIVYEIGVAITVGWLAYIGTGDWKQGVGAALVSMFGGSVRRGAKWYAEK